jgi:hypothetical protein
MASSLQAVEGSSVYYVQGDGYFEEIASPWRKKEPEVENVEAASPLMTPARVF